MHELASSRVDGSLRPFFAREGRRWLRWASVIDGRIVEDETLPPNQTLTVDRVSRSAHALPLFYFADERWHLRVDARVEGRIGSVTLAEIRARSHDAEDFIDIELDDTMQGRLVLADRAILFQLVDRPAKRTHRELPPSMRGGLFARTDWFFTAFAVASLFLHFAFVVVVLDTDWPVEQSLIPPRAVELIIEEVPPPIDPPIERMTNNDARTRTEGPISDEPSPSRERTRSPRGEPSLNADARAREAAEQTLALVLGGLSAERTGISDLIANGGPSVNEAALLETMRAPEPPSGDVRPGERDPGCRTCETLRRPLAANDRAGHEIDEGRPIEERRLIVRPSPDEEIDVEDVPGFDVRELIRQLGGRMAAIRRCYEHEISVSNPDLEGRITIELQVMPVGTVAELRAAENTTGSDTLAACALRSVRTLRVRRAPEAPVRVRYPIVFHRQQ